MSPLHDRESFMRHRGNYALVMCIWWILFMVLGTLFIHISTQYTATKNVYAPYSIVSASTVQKHAWLYKCHNVTSMHTIHDVGTQSVYAYNCSSSPGARCHTIGGYYDCTDMVDSLRDGYVHFTDREWLRILCVYVFWLIVFFASCVFFVFSSMFVKHEMFKQVDFALLFAGRAAVPEKDEQTAHALEQLNCSFLQGLDILDVKVACLGVFLIALTQVLLFMACSQPVEVYMTAQGGAPGTEPCIFVEYTASPTRITKATQTMYPYDCAAHNASKCYQRWTSWTCASDGVHEWGVTVPREYLIYDKFILFAFYMSVVFLCLLNLWCTKNHIEQYQLHLRRLSIVPMEEA